MTSRIPALADDRVGPLLRLAYRYARRRFGQVPEPFAVLAHHPGLFWTTAVAESLTERVATTLPAGLRDLATVRVATRVGCSWCVDFGTMLAFRAGLDPGHLHRALADAAPEDPAPEDPAPEDPAPEDDADLDDLERLVLRYADAMTAQPPEVTEALVADLDARLGHRGLVELTHVVALENMRARTYRALGIRDQGFAAECAVPPR